jgi:hypothetical protein
MSSITLNQPNPFNGGLKLSWQNPLYLSFFAAHLTVINTEQSNGRTYRVELDEVSFIAQEYYLTSLPTPLGSIPLVNGNTYSIQLTMHYESSSATEQFAYSNWVSGTPSGTPDACIISNIYTLSNSDTNATISFIMGADNGNTIDRVRFYLCDNTIPSAPVTTSATVVGLYVPGVTYTQLISNSTALGNLVPGHSYLLSMEAINEAGAGALSNSINIVSSSIPMTAVVSQVLSGQSTKLIVDVEPQPYIFGITSVVLYTSVDNGANWTAFSPAFTATDSYGNLITTGLAITGLTNATAYLVSAVYYNSSGSSPLPPAQIGPFKSGVPCLAPSLSGPTLAASTTSSNDVLTAGFTLTIGTIIPTTVTATFSGPNGVLGTKTLNQATTGAGTLALNLPLGTLVSGDQYSVSLVASAVVPSGLASAWLAPPLVNGSIYSPAVTQTLVISSVPDAPSVTNVYCTTASGILGLQVLWTAPLNDGYSPITNYIVSLFSSSFALLNTFTVVPVSGFLAETAFISLTGPASLVIGSNYYVRVTASNATGTSTNIDYSGPIRAVNPVLSAPANATITQVSDTLLKFSWSPYTFSSGQLGSFNVFSYDSEGVSTLLAILPANAKSYDYPIDTTYPVQEQVVLGVQALASVTTIVNNVAVVTTYESAVSIQTKILGGSPTVSYNSISSNSAGNSVVVFTINNNNNNIVSNGIFLFVVPATNAPLGTNPVTVVPPDNTKNVVTYAINLGYPALITSSQPSILITACNSIGSGYYQHGLTDSP